METALQEQAARQQSTQAGCAGAFGNDCRSKAGLETSEIKGIELKLYYMRRALHVNTQRGTTKQKKKKKKRLRS